MNYKIEIGFIVFLALLILAVLMAAMRYLGGGI